MFSKVGQKGDQKRYEEWKEEHIYDGLGCSGAKVRGKGQQPLLIQAPSIRVLCQAKDSLVTLLPQSKEQGDCSARAC